MLKVNVDYLLLTGNEGFFKNLENNVSLRLTTCTRFKHHYKKIPRFREVSYGNPLPCIAKVVACDDTDSCGVKLK